MTRTVEYDIHYNNFDSSVLSDIYYDGQNRELFVKFKHGGLAGYKNVGPVLAKQFMEAPSIGSYYSRIIKTGVHNTSTTSGDVELVERKPKNTKTYVVVGQVMRPTNLRLAVEAESMEQAIEKFRASQSGEVEVTSVSLA